MPKQAASQSDVVLRGGGFLVGEVPPDEVFCPEQFGEEERLIGRTAADFVDKEVRPKLDAIERGDHTATIALLKQAGNLGLLGGDIPEAYGGYGLKKVATTLVTERMSYGASFAISFGAHTGIGTLPIVLFGTEEQKRRYLPSLANGEMIAAYALTEPEAGSDARGIRTSARLVNGEYRVSGEKQWITNSGFADLFVTYAKVDGEQMTGFLIERKSSGVSVGPEFQKMGLHGSSTCTVRLDDVPVPSANVLGEVGRGHIVAFNVLNIGRWKLAAGCLGSCKAVLGISARYAKGRRQFGKPIAEYTAIQQKLAQMAARTFALDSLVYRTAGLLDRSLAAAESGPGAGEDYPASRAVGEYAIEASINKVFGSETLDFVADEGVQIHGGYGFIKGFEVERAYRDSRINRIFEGTNEINRMLIPGTLLRRAMRGELPLLAAVEKARQELTAVRPPAAPPSADGSLAGDFARLADAKKAALIVAGVGAQKYMARAEEEQEYLLGVADLAILIFAWESALIRAKKIASTAGGAVSGDRAELSVDLARLFGDHAAEGIETTARRTLAGIEKGDTLQMQLSALRRLARYTPADTVSLGRRIARRVLDANGYQL